MFTIVGASIRLVERFAGFVGGKSEDNPKQATAWASVAAAVVTATFAPSTVDTVGSTLCSLGSWLQGG